MEYPPVALTGALLGNELGVTKRGLVSGLGLSLDLVGKLLGEEVVEDNFRCLDKLARELLEGAGREVVGAEEGLEEGNVRGSETNGRVGGVRSDGDGRSRGLALVRFTALNSQSVQATRGLPDGCARRRRRQSPPRLRQGGGTIH